MGGRRARRGPAPRVDPRPAAPPAGRPRGRAPGRSDRPAARRRAPRRRAGPAPRWPGDSPRPPSSAPNRCSERHDPSGGAADQPAGRPQVEPEGARRSAIVPTTAPCRSTWSPRRGGRGRAPPDEARRELGDEPLEVELGDHSGTRIAVLSGPSSASRSGSPP